MSRKPYPTDITEAEWKLLESLIPRVKTGGRPRTVDIREIINAILYVQSSGCPWRLVPHDLPPWPTVYDYFRVWRNSGVWERIIKVLQEGGRQIPKKKAKQQTSDVSKTKNAKRKVTVQGGSSDLAPLSCCEN